MEKKAKSKKLIVIIVTLVLFVTVSLTVKPVENPNFIQKIIQFIFLPVQNVVMYPINEIKKSIIFLLK